MLFYLIKVLHVKVHVKLFTSPSHLTDTCPNHQLSLPDEAFSYGLQASSMTHTHTLMLKNKQYMTNSEELKNYTQLCSLTELELGIGLN